MRSINFAVVVSYIVQVVGGFDNTHRSDGYILFGRDRHNYHGSVGEVSQRYNVLLNTCISTKIESGRKSGVLHIQHLAEIADVPSVNPLSIYIQLHIDMVKGLEDVGNPASLIIIVNTIKYHIFHHERLGGGYDSDHPVCHRNPVIIIGVNVFGGNVPGGVLEVGLGCECGDCQ